MILSKKIQEENNMKNRKLTKKYLLLKIGRIVAAIAIMVTTLNVNSTCMYMIHQPTLPDSAKKLRKF